MVNLESLKYLCLFGGGAIRGAGHVGVLKAFDELGIEPVAFGGSSVGSIIAVLRAIGYSTDELAEIFLSVNFELFRDISFGFNTKFAFSKGEIFLDWFRELVEKKFYGEEYQKGQNPPVKFKDINKDLFIMSTNLKDFTCNEFSTYATPDFEVAMAVRISCCAPGLMRAVNLDDKLLVDGDLQKGKPMWSLSDYLKNYDGRILEIRLEGEFTGDDTKPLDYLNGMYSCITSSETSFIKSIYGENDKYDYLTVNTGGVIVFDFNYSPEKRQAIIDDGYNCTMEYFKKILPAKKHRIYNIYAKILDELRHVQELMLRKKFNGAKNILSELFIILAETKSEIDKNIYKDILLFQKLLFSNVKSGLLGRSRCENLTTVREQLISIINKLTVKNKEFEEYFKVFNV